MANEIFEVIEDENSDGLIITIDEEYLMSKDEALELTDSIKSTATATCLLLQRAHDQKAWKSMGYKSWTDYIEGEFKFTRARSYQLLAQASVIKEIADVSNSEIYLTEKEAKLIKKELPTITQKIKEETRELVTAEDREEKTKEIIDGEIQHALNTDKSTYDDGRDIDSMIEEDGGQGIPKEVYSGQSYQSDENKWGDVESSNIAPAAEANFYVENLNRTLSVMEAFPKATDLAQAMGFTEEEKVELRNRVKYSLAWLEALCDSLA